MGIEMSKGVYYGVFLKEENWEKVENLIIGSGIFPDWECIDPEPPDMFDRHFRATQAPSKCVAFRGR